MMNNDTNDPMDKSHNSFIWPVEAANNALFQLPRTWGKTSSTLCKLEYDATNRYLLIVQAVQPDSNIKTTTTTTTPDSTSKNVSKTGSVILDVIDIDDMIGASISIHMNSTTTATHATVPERTNNEHSTNRATNEPECDLLMDKKGYAVLSIYVYPREDSSFSVASLFTMIWSFFACILGLTSTTNPNRQSQPQPNYKRPSAIATDKVYPLPNCGNRHANHRMITLEPTEDFKHFQVLVYALRQLASSMASSSIVDVAATTATEPSNVNADKIASSSTNDKCLIIVNPCSGPKKNGATVCKEVVTPMLEQAGYHVDVIVTKHAHHAKEIVSATTTTTTTTNAIDILDYNTIVLLGGDGIVHEVFNGISCRSDHQHVFRTMTFGIVGCGTANGMAASLAFASKERWGAINETFLIAKKQTSYIDLSHYEILSLKSTSTTTADASATTSSVKNGTSTSSTIQETGKDNTDKDTTKPTSSSSIEKDDRADSTAATRAAAVRSSVASSNEIMKYTGCLTFSWALISDIDLESECISWFGPRRFDVWAVWRVIFLRTYPATFSFKPITTTTTTRMENERNNQDVIHKTILPSVHESVPEDWIVIKDEFVLFYPSQVTHAGMNTYNSPPSTLNDGMFQVMILRGNLSRIRLASILLGLETGTHVGQYGVEFIPCTAFRLEPACNSGTKKQQHKTINNIDGEAVEDGPIQAYVEPSAVRVYCKGQ